MDNSTLVGTPANVSEQAGIPYNQHPQVVAGRMLITYVSPIIILLGTLGNAASAAVMLRPRLRKGATTFYLTAVAVTDTLVLYTGLLRQWLRLVLKTDVRDLSDPGCKIHVFLVYFLMQLEAWLLVSVATERVCAVLLPHQAKRWYTRKGAAIQVGVITSTLASVNAHYFWTVRLVTDDPDSPDCASSDRSYDHFFDVIWPWIDFCLVSLLPFILMLAGNILILLRLSYVKFMRKSGVPAMPGVKMTSMTAILLTITFAFFLTTAPLAVYLTVSEQWLKAAQTTDAKAQLYLTWAAVSLLAYCNYALNFFLYCISGPRFRKELRDMVCWNRVTPVEMVHSLTMHPANDEVIMADSQQTTA